MEEVNETGDGIIFSGRRKNEITLIDLHNFPSFAFPHYLLIAGKMKILFSFFSDSLISIKVNYIN